MDPALVLVIAGVLGVLSFGGWVAFKAWPAVRKVSHFIDDLTGEPARPGFPARPGLMERMASLEETQEAIRHQVQNSHATNLRDDVDELKEGLEAIRQSLTEPIPVIPVTPVVVEKEEE